MEILNYLKKLFKPTKTGNIINIYLRDQKCGNKIKVLVRKSYDIQKVYNSNEEAAYKISKVIICDKCFNKITIESYFDRKYNVISRKIEGGTYIKADEYEQEK